MRGPALECRYVERLCYTQAASEGSRMIAAVLKSGILILIVPPTLCRLVWFLSCIASDRCTGRSGRGGVRRAIWKTAALPSSATTPWIHHARYRYLREKTHHPSKVLDYYNP